MSGFVQLEIKLNDLFFQKLPKELILSRLKFLTETFKLNYSKYFPTTIQYDGDLLYLLHLSETLQRLKTFPGFNDHVEQFNTDVDSTYFVTLMAGYLTTITSSISLEPTVKDHPKKADIYANINGADVYFECKNSKHDAHSAFGSDYGKWYEALQSSITKACDVIITYSNCISEAELVELAALLQRKLPLVTGEGEIYNDNRLKVEVTNIRDGFTDNGDFTMFKLWDNYHDKALVPGMLISRHGRAIMFFNRDANGYRNIEGQLKNCRKKVPKDKPLVAVIHSESLPGKLTENIKFVSSQFNENKYTSINGVLFVRYIYSYERLIEYEFHYVNNPFARNQVPQLAGLFKSTYRN